MARWTAPRALAALALWVGRHGRAPTAAQWRRTCWIDGVQMPTDHQAIVMFGSWNKFLVAGGCEPRAAHAPKQATREEMLEAVLAWKRLNRHWPTIREWATRDLFPRPGVHAILREFGTWNAFLLAAGWNGRRKRARRWTRKLVIEAMLDWTFKHGRFPTIRDWDRAGAGHPSASTVVALFGSWNAARRRVGYVGSDRAQLRRERTLKTAA